ncbi:MAG: hypothetical protein ACR2RL_03740, partial [Gammaproteobacteria bacterium]
MPSLDTAAMPRPDTARAPWVHRVLPALRPHESPLEYSLYTLAAIIVAMIFLFPIYWGLSTSLRSPIEALTVTGFGIPWIHFEPTLQNWRDELAVPETQDALVNSTLISTLATALALVIATPAA